MDLRWYQHDACNAAWHDLCANAGNSVIVAPTGSGKSLLVAELARRTIEAGYRVLVLAHRAELLVQNADKLRALLPWNVRVGVYSAGLNQRSTDDAVICAGIQSVHKRASEFGARHLVLIDEVHLVPFGGEGMYRTFLDDLRTINPKLRMVGLTATPYRTDNGKLCRADGLFQRVCYEIPVRKLIDEGWLCGLTNQPTETTVNTSNLHVRGGEFVAREMEDLFDSSGVIGPACLEIATLTTDRKGILVFCSGVEHAGHVRDLLEQLTGGQVGLVTGETLPLERATTLEAFKSGRLRMLCNVDVLTTGFDAPNIDCIAVLRATMSPGLFAQIVGRGLRIAPGKESCLVLDFGNNIQRHGAIDDPNYGQKKDRQAQPGEAPQKTCPNCGESLPAGCLLCEHCGFSFPPRAESRHESEADHENEILNNAKPPEWFTVSQCHASIHVKKRSDGPPTLRVDYEIEEGNLTISEWVCLAHEGYARAKAIAWWVKRCIAPPPLDIQSAMDLWDRGALAVPRRIQAKREGRFWRVIEYEFDESPPESWSDEPIAETVPFDAIDDDDLPF